jgi:cytochrome o ubiquinol oxidase subunit IV
MSVNQNVEPEYGTGQKTLKVYVSGLLLCVILTLIPFIVVFVHSAPVEQTQSFHWLVNLFPGRAAWTNTSVYTLIFICAFIQFLVQVLCFLRLNLKTAQGKSNVYTFVFTIIIVSVLVAGTMWIMYSLHHRMMDNGGSMANAAIIKK